ncbi:pseudouridine synthase [Thermaerobacter subterraneus]|uniref:Pseudouridine synthase n=1 Tax=Thermaerobacter subterraneus DSM 13965 TaxID=867903 RepID=K6NYC6_9FIRM|nr:pseudouridine synthase [Thermaerobacter subterraneus]EKP93880.1 pseudouridine synthase family protein [Thermaerobacter subterraneus DSM 13965]
MPAERLQKILSRAGVASRRQVEAWIAAGRLTVNGRPAVLGTRADPARDVIALDGRPLAGLAERLSRKRYVLFHKPRGMVTTLRDPQGRPNVGDFCRRHGLQGLHPVGRLDFDSEGLLLLTDDGELTFALTHPRHEVDKVYHVLVRGDLDPARLRRLRDGVLLDDGPARARIARVLRPRPGGGWVEVVLREGRKRQVRRMCQAVGWQVVRLVRVAVGPLRLGRLAAGAWRPLSRQEVESLRVAAGLPPRPDEPAPRHRQAGEGRPARGPAWGRRVPAGLAGRPPGPARPGAAARRVSEGPALQGQGPRGRVSRPPSGRNRRRKANHEG